MPGSGTITPIGGGGVGGGLDLAQPIPYTLLSLDRFARVMGINPAHFWGASAPHVDPQVMPVVMNCSAIWFKYAWQDTDRVGRLDVAQEIAIAERDIAAAVGFWPAPTWIEADRVVYPRPYSYDSYGVGLDVRGRPKSVAASWGKIIDAGRRAVTLIGTAAVGGGSLSYTDEDSDGLYETATIILPTSYTNTCRIKVYHSGMDGDPDWEIREPRSIEISGGFVTIVMDAWLFINPDLYEELPTTETPDLIDIGTVINFVDSVDVYYEAPSPSQSAVEFYWEPDYLGCQDTDAGCTETSQEGCLRVRDSANGLVVPVPASYTAPDWNSANWTVSREPDSVALWYRAGDVDKRNPACGKLSAFWAQTIAWLAASRLERQFCQCGNAESLHVWLRQDRALTEQNHSFFNSMNQIDNPFGTRQGEVATWRRISKLVRKRGRVAVI